MRDELEEMLRGRSFILAFSVMLLCFFGFSIPSWIICPDLEMEYMPSALQQSIGGIFFGGVMLLLPFCACTACSGKQVDEIRQSTFEWKLLRCSVKKYAVSKIFGATISGALAVSLAFILHALIWNLIALPYNPVVYPYQDIGFWDECLYAQWENIYYGLPIYISMALGIAIAGGLWATLGMATAMWVSDKVLAIAIPIGIYYLWFNRFFPSVLGWNVPSPDTLYNDALTLELVWQGLLTHAIIWIIGVALYYIGLKRRAQYA